MKRTVVLGITLGDVGGIGPEVALKAACGRRWPENLRLVLIGSGDVVRSDARRLNLPVPALVKSPQESASCVSVWEPALCCALVRRVGQITVSASRHAVAWIEASVGACEAGALDAMVTAPISKEGLLRAGLKIPGHTELLARLTRTREFAMMLLGGGLRVVLVTRHIPISRVSAAVSVSGIAVAAQLTAGALVWLGAKNQRVGVCGLNPHAGDGGAIGAEDRLRVAPAVRWLRKRGYAVEGPIPSDVIFYQAVKGRYGAVVAMYHDQGLAPLKMRAFEKGVNLTLGLPIVRTSPDHGTAFDIAGQGVANPGSMIEAIRLAYRLAQRPNPWAKN